MSWAPDNAWRKRWQTATGNIADPSEREAIIGQTVIAWLAANRSKPLPRFENGSVPAAWKSLLDQMYMLAGEGQRRIAESEDFVREIGLTPLRLVLSYMTSGNVMGKVTFARSRSGFGYVTEMGEYAVMTSLGVDVSTLARLIESGQV